MKNNNGLPRQRQRGEVGAKLRLGAFWVFGDGYSQIDAVFLPGIDFFGIFYVIKEGCHWHDMDMVAP